MTSGDHRFVALAAQYGPIPPAGGPARDRYMMSNGTTELNTAMLELTASLDLLKPWLSTLPRLFKPLESRDDSLRRTTQKSSRSEWQEFGKSIPQSIRSQVQPHIRRSEKAAVAALNYLEDTIKAQEAHEAIHRAAFIRSGLYGCPIAYHDGSFWKKCSIEISHLRMGMSLGMTSDTECSICGRRAEDCEHMMGTTYSVLAKVDEVGNCTICNLHNCSHERLRRYSVIAQGIVRNISIHEISIVTRPRYPLARITEWTTEVPETYKQYAEAGLLNCDGCLGPCKGLNEITDWDLSAL